MIENIGRQSCAQRRAIISGAAGSVGEYCARSLARLGVQLTLVDIDQVMVNRLASELGADAHCFNVLTDANIDRFLKKIAARAHVDLLINAAGAGHVRMLGMMHMSRAFVKAFRDRPAMIVNISSPAIRGVDPFAYAGSQVAFRRLSEGLSDSMLPPGHTILTVDSSTRDEQLLDVIGQWCRSARCAEDPAIALRPMRRTG